MIATFYLHFFFLERESNGSSRRSSVYPTTSRRCSEAVAEFAATGDLEAVAEILKAGKDSPEDDDEGFAMPPEKERRRLVLVVSCVGLTMTFMAAIMVGITLGLSHMMENSQFSKYQEQREEILYFLIHGLHSEAFRGQE